MKKIIEKNIGEKVELSTISVLVNSVIEEQDITEVFEMTITAGPNKKFVIVEMSVKNITKSKLLFSHKGFVLLDDKGRQFRAHENPTGNIAKYLHRLTIPPDITYGGIIVYEIPKDATSYSLVVVKGGTMEVFKIRLK
jgi:hypothetical protein